MIEGKLVGTLPRIFDRRNARLPWLSVVKEIRAELKVGAVELARQIGIAGARDCAPGRAVQSGVAGAPNQLHIGDLSVGQNLELNCDHALLEDWRVHLIRNERVPRLLRDVVPALKPVAEVDALRVRKDLDAAGTSAGVHREAA